METLGRIIGWVVLIAMLVACGYALVDSRVSKGAVKQEPVANVANDVESKAITGSSKPNDFSDFTGITETRPKWPGQIRAVSDLRPGQFVYLVHKSYKDLVLIVSSGYRAYGNCQFEYVYWQGEGPESPLSWRGFCQDFSMIPYRSGWNRYNYLKEASRPDLEITELDNILSTLEPAFDE